MKNILDKIPTQILMFFAIFMALAPFAPEPHLWQKIKMLADGDLTKPMDIFDLFVHGTPALLLLIKLLLNIKTSEAKP